MKKLFILTVFLSVLCLQGNAQVFETSETFTRFFSKTPIEDIEGKSKETAGLIDTTKNTFFFKIQINSFEFKSGLMRDHFNENYMESEEFPTANFKGELIGNYSFNKNGFYVVKAIGDLTIHGETRNVSIPTKISVNGSAINFDSSFKVKLEDYKIDIPTVVYNKIAEEIDVSITGSLVPKQK